MEGDDAHSEFGHLVAIGDIWVSSNEGIAARIDSGYAISSPGGRALKIRREIEKGILPGDSSQAMQGILRERGRCVEPISGYSNSR